MKHRITPIVILCLALAGCAQNRAAMLTKTAAAEDIYTTSLKALADFRRQGVINDDSYRQIDKWRKVAAGAIDTAYAAALSEDRTAFGQATAALAEAMGHILSFRASVKLENKPDGVPIP